MSDVIRIGIIDDHPLFLAGVERTLSRAQGMKIVATGVSAHDAISICERNTIDVLLLDITIPGGGGLSALKTIRAKHPSTKVVMVTGSDDDEHVSEALSNGAHGYVLKGANANELRDAVQRVSGGEAYVTAAVATRLLVERIRATSVRQSQAAKPVPLSAQKQKIYDLMCQGLTNGEIAKRMDLSAFTVRNYVSMILKSMNTRNRVTAIQSADAQQLARVTRSPKSDDMDD